MKNRHFGHKLSQMVSPNLYPHQIKNYKMSQARVKIGNCFFKLNFQDEKNIRLRNYTDLYKNVTSDRNFE